VGTSSPVLFAGLDDSDLSPSFISILRRPLVTMPQ